MSDGRSGREVFESNRSRLEPIVDGLTAHIDNARPDPPFEAPLIRERYWTLGGSRPGVPRGAGPIVFADWLGRSNAIILGEYSVRNDSDVSLEEHRGCLVIARYAYGRLTITPGYPSLSGIGFPPTPVAENCVRRLTELEYVLIIHEVPPRPENGAVRAAESEFPWSATLVSLLEGRAILRFGFGGGPQSSPCSAEIRDDHRGDPPETLISESCILRHIPNARFR